jgi:Icc-related predicted phosphoesterase
LHVGTSARAKDLCPHPTGHKGIDDQYVHKFLGFLKREKLTAHYLILPGDVTETANPREVALASQVICDVAKALKVPKARIVFVPGNHDVDWSVLADKGNPVRWSQRYAPITYKDYVFRSIMRRGRGTLIDEPYITCWEFEDLVVVGYNSSWHDNRDELIHHGRMDHGHLSALRRVLERIDRGKDRLNLFLLHHHPVAYDAPDGTADFSQLVNAEQLWNLLRDFGFDMIIHGHTHQPRFHTVLRDAGHPIGVLAAGSFSLQLPPQWHGKVGNQFHVISVDDRVTPGVVRGRIRSWTYYYTHGWIPSIYDRDGIAHLEPFGAYPDPAQLSQAIQAVLLAMLHNRAWIKWTDLVHADPALAYVRPIAVLGALRDLASRFGFIVHRETLEDMIILKEPSTHA